MRTIPLVGVAIAATLTLAACGDPASVGDGPAAAPGVDASAPLEPQMKQAIQSGDADLVAAILEAGLSADADLGGGVTPLHTAASAGDEVIVQALIDAGATVDSRLPQGQTPLMNAASTGDAGTIAVLLGAGADALAKDHLHGKSAIHYSARSGNIETLSALVDAGSPVDLVDDEGQTVLIEAVKNDRVECVAFLISRGVDVNLPDGAGTTALAWAQFNGSDEIAAALEAAGATA